MRPKNAIGKTLFLQPIVPLKPNPDHHRTDDSPAKELTTVRSVRERARARPRATTLRPGDRGATFHNYSKSVVKTVSRPHPHAHLP